MDIRSICLSLGIATMAVALPLASAPAAAASGLAVAAPESLWPQWRARLAVQTASLAPVSLTGRPAGSLAGGGAPPQALQGGAVLGDYTFARPSFGAFRASGGLLIGAIGGAPGLSVAGGLAGSIVDLSVHNLGASGAPPGGDALTTMPYFGLGFTGVAWRSVAITADLGMVAERPSTASGVGRALFGNQGMESALRDMRLSPVLQLGVRYTF